MKAQLMKKCNDNNSALIKSVQSAKNTRLIFILVAVPLILLIPLTAMYFTDEVDWNKWDFLIMGILLLVTGLSCELVLRRVKSLKNRIIVCGLVLLAFLLIWIEIAVGLFNTPFAGD